MSAEFSPSLVQLAGSPMASAFQNVGSSLVTLGQQKVDEAKEKAAKQEATEKERALQQAQATKNLVQNPSAARAVHKRYGTDPDGPLALAGVPSRANADLGMIDFGVEKEAKVPTAVHSFKGKDGHYYSEMSDGSTRKSSVPYKPDADTQTRPFVEFYTAADGTRVGIKPDGTQQRFGQVKDYGASQGDKNTPAGYTRAAGLGSKALSYLFDNGLATNVGGNVYARPEDLEKAKQLESFGNQTIEVR